MQLLDSISVLSGVGASRQKTLEDGGLGAIKDIFNYIPYSYEDSTNILSVEDLFETINKHSVWEIPNEKFAIKGVIEKLTSFKTRRGFSIIHVTISQSGFDKKIRAIWFNQEFLLSQLHENKEYLFYGKIKYDKGTLVLQSPKFEEFIDGEIGKKLGKVTPIYRRIKKVTTTYIEKFVNEVLKGNLVSEYLPKESLEKYNLENLERAYLDVHMPSTYGKTIQGKRRLEVQELLEVKEDYESHFVSTKLKVNKNDIGKIRDKIQSCSKSLPFTLTDAQQAALNSILETLSEGNRLDSFVYGDVGSGKTIIALLLAIGFAAIGKSSILIAPTTILAKQHAENSSTLINDLGLDNLISVEHVSSGKKKRFSVNSPTIFIGTHALLFKQDLLESKEIEFVCIDEQHRFGVEQRMQLDPEKKRHVITLSATPIPRTLALSFLGFSQSVEIASKPVGRKEIITKIVPFDKEEVTYMWIRKKIDEGGRVYFVFPRIDDGEGGKHSLISSAEALSEAYFKDISTAVLYGSLKDQEKQEIMSDFANGKTQLLFSTSVIEVGVDVPEATIIAIHGAELFGLAQLHQLRGRVGRSDKQSFCFLFIGDHENEAVTERLSFFSDHSDGLSLAEYDLNNRGMGTIAGLEQSGISELKIASFSNLGLLSDAVEIYNYLKDNNIDIPRYIR